MKTYVIIPARYQSTRLPGKPLMKIGNKPIIQWVYEQAKKAIVDDVIVATDDTRIVECVEQFNGKVCMTAAHHTSGTERIGEVIGTLSLKGDDVVINLQSDEPFLSPSLIDQLAKTMTEEKRDVATFCEPLASIEAIFNPNVVKVLFDANGDAIYFSRAPIPWFREGFQSEHKIMPSDFTFYRHVGIYAYRVQFIKEYVQVVPSPIENIEALEQLRILWYGKKIRILKAEGTVGLGIDTPADLEAARKWASSPRET